MTNEEKVTATLDRGWFLIFTLSVAVNCSITIFFSCYCISVEVSIILPGDKKIGVILISAVDPDLDPNPVLDPDPNTSIRMLIKILTLVAGR